MFTSVCSCHSRSNSCSRTFTEFFTRRHKQDPAQGIRAMFTGIVEEMGSVLRCERQDAMKL